MKKAALPLIVTMLFQVIHANGEMPDVVSGNLRQFTDNGSWSLFQGPGVIIDDSKKMLITGSSPCRFGVGGNKRAGNAEVIRCVLSTGKVDRFVLHKGHPDSQVCDNRYAPTLFLRPDGKYLATCISPSVAGAFSYRIFSGEYWGSDWGEAFIFDWNQATEGAITDLSPNSSLVYLSSEKKLYHFVLGIDGSLYFAVSTDYGTTWNYGGQIIDNADQVENHTGFALFSSNGDDRIDLILTESGAVFHGWISEGALHNSSGAVIDESVTEGKSVAGSDQLTRLPVETLFNDGEVLSVWCSDLHSYGNDTIVAILTAGFSAENKNVQTSSNHGVVYCMFDGDDWSFSPIISVGINPVVASETYTDQTALDPGNRNRLYISSTFNPAGTDASGVHEIFMGTTEDDGRTWNWEPITLRSTRDNMNPVVPIWHGGHSAVLWLRGRCHSPHHYDAAVVGIITMDAETFDKKRYIDSNAENSFDGCCFDSLMLEYSEEDSDADHRWHQNNKYGNSGTVIVASEGARYENALLIKHIAALTEPGTYDFWTNFWGKPSPSLDWLISTSLTPDVELYRQMACRTVNENEYNEPPVISIGDSLFLYQAYAGRVTIDTANSIEIFVDDHITMHGSEYGLDGGDVNRTWWDGISYARLETPAQIQKEKTLHKKNISAFQIHQSSYGTGSQVRIFWPAEHTKTATITFYDCKGRKVLSYIVRNSGSGNVSILVDPSTMTTGVYLCRIFSGTKTATATVRIGL